MKCIYSYALDIDIVTYINAFKFVENYFFALRFNIHKLSTFFFFILKKQVTIQRIQSVAVKK